MKTRHLSLLRLGPIILAAACGITIAEEKPKITLSPELAIHAPDVPDEENGIVRFEKRFTPFDQTTIAALGEIAERLREGVAVEDPALFEKLETSHRQARELLKAPARHLSRKDVSE
ncbi:hypothetical protein OKA04_22090 [Luteolibacter flavescens]|uniref:Uncharacterized protein n=1 Tax=Luteolibacter flavescens TaxID=1859460 RepID=A0ABT3FV17_9BACT|nr:hypothetical protein [Luteolibacter flavescens]MCW1887443.1 hypothetical protein [Luteolibacter flavescens]